MKESVTTNEELQISLPIGKMRNVLGKMPDVFLLTSGCFFWNAGWMHFKSRFILHKNLVYLKKTRMSGPPFLFLPNTFAFVPLIMERLGVSSTDPQSICFGFINYGAAGAVTSTPQYLWIGFTNSGTTKKFTPNEILTLLSEHIWSQSFFVTGCRKT